MSHSLNTSKMACFAAMLVCLASCKDVKHSHSETAESEGRSFHEHRQIGSLVHPSNWETIRALNKLGRVPSAIEMEVVEIGHDAIPLLDEAMRPTNLLDSGWNITRKLIAAHCLFLIGGEQSATVLRKHFTAGPDRITTSYLCGCLASTGSTDDIRYLTTALDDKDWNVRESAAYSLGVMRAQQAIAPLEALVRKGRGDYGAFAAAESLKWIKNPPLAVNVDTKSSDKEDIIIAIFKNGIPRIDESDRYIDMKGAREWVIEKRTLRVMNTLRRSEDSCIPELFFSVYISRDAMKAIACVSLSFGSLNASGFTYSLRKEKGEWKVQGLMAIWVS